MIHKQVLGKFMINTFISMFVNMEKTEDYISISHFQSCAMGCDCLMDMS